MKTAFAYAKMNKKIKNLKSISEQFKEIDAYAKDHAYKILNRYYDTDNARYDKKSIGIEKMLRDALLFSPSAIFLEDEEMLSLDSLDMKAAVSKLREQGIQFLALSAEKNAQAVSEKSKTESFEETFQKLTLKNSDRESEKRLQHRESHSIGVSEMIEKALVFRDKKTGYMFKKPGKVPFGYRPETIQVVDEKQNKVHKKLIWTLEEEAAELIHVIVVELYTKRRMSYNDIKLLLNKEKIKSPHQKTWGISSVANLLTEEKLQLYAGIGVLRDERFLEEQRVENAHPAILSQEEMEGALSRREENKQAKGVGRSRKGSFLYTGLNFENETMFRCESCGGRVVGYQNSSDQWFKYICASYRADGMHGCTNSWRLDKEWLEDSILAGIQEKFLAEDKKSLFFMDIPKSIRAGFKHLNVEKRVITERFQKCEVEGNRILNAIKSGMVPELLSKEMASIERETAQLSRKLARIEEDMAELSLVDEEGLRQVFEHFEALYAHCETEDKRRLVRIFVKQIRMIPETKKIKVEFNNSTLVLKHYRDYETMLKRMLMRLQKA